MEQAIPDLPVAAPRSELTAAGRLLEAQRWKNKIALLVGEEVTAVGIDRKDERPSNQHTFLAFDHLVRWTFGRNGTDFLPARKHKLLSPHEYRYFVTGPNMEDKDGAMTAGRRACIHNRLTDDTRFECPMTFVDEKRTDLTLHSIPDQGPKQWRALMRLYVAMGMRGWVIADPWHIGWGAIRHACSDVNEWLLVLEVTVVQNCRKAPYLNQGMLGQIRDVSKDYFQYNYIDCAVFKLFYPLIVQARFNKSGVWPCNFGTNEHKSFVWKSLRDSKLRVLSGTYVKLMRFSEWMAALEKEEVGLKECWYDLLFFIVLVGLHRGWWTSVAALTNRSLGGLDGAPGAADGAAIPTGAEGAPLGMAQSREEAKLKRRGCINTLHYAGCTMAPTRTYKITCMLCTTTKPSRTQEGIDMQRCSTIKGSLYYNVDMAQESWLETLVATTQTLHTPEGMRSAGFFAPGVAEFHLEPELDKTDLDDEVGLKMYYHIMALINRKLPFYLSHSRAPPRMFCALLEKKVVRTTLQKAMDIWQALTILEDIASHGNLEIAQFLNRCVWPSMTWPREMITALAEVHFKNIPKLVVFEPMVKFSEGFASTWVLELAIGVEKTAAECSRNDNIGRREMWHSLQASALLQDHDHKQPKVTLETKAEAKLKNLKHAFDATVTQCSFDEDDLLSIGADNWHCPSPELFRAMGGMTDVMVKLSRCPDNVSTLWKAMFFQKGYIVQKRSSAVAYAVAGTIQDGAYLWKLNMKHCRLPTGENINWLEFPPEMKAEDVIVEMVLDDALYRTSAPSVWSPEHVYAKFEAVDQSLRPSGCAIVPTRFTSVIEAAALNAFGKMTLEFLDKLLKERIVYPRGTKRPTSEKAVIEALVRDILPELTDDQVMAIVNMRAERVKNNWLAAGDHAIFIEGGNLALFEDLLDADELDKLKKSKAAFVDGGQSCSEG